MTTTWLKRHYLAMALILLALLPRLLDWSHQLAGDDEALHSLASLRLAATRPWALDPLQNTVIQLFQAFHGWVMQLFPFLVYVGVRALGLPIGEATVNLPALLLNLGAIVVWYLWARRIWGIAPAFWGVLIFAWLAESVRLGRSLHGNENLQMLGWGIACLVLERHVGTDPFGTPGRRWALGWPLLLYVGMDNVFFLFGFAYCIGVGLFFTRGPALERLRQFVLEFGWRNPAAWVTAALVGLYVVAAVGTVILEGELSTHGFLLRTFLNENVRFGFYLEDLFEFGQVFWSPIFFGAAGFALIAGIGLARRDRGLAMLCLIFGVYFLPMLFGGYAIRLIILGLPLALITIRIVNYLAVRFGAWLWLLAPTLALAALGHSLGAIYGIGPLASKTPGYSTVLAPNGLKAIGYLLRAEFNIRESVQTIHPRGIDLSSLRLAMNMESAGQFYVGARYGGVDDLDRIQPELVVTFESARPDRYAAPDQQAVLDYVIRRDYRCAYAVLDGGELLARIWLRGDSYNSACQQTYQYAPLAEAFDREYYRISDFASVALGGY